MNILTCLIVICLLSSNKCFCFSVFKNIKKEILQGKADFKNDINKQKVVLDVKNQFKVSPNSTESFIPSATKCKYLSIFLFVHFVFKSIITKETTVNEQILLYL